MYAVRCYHYYAFNFNVNLCANLPVQTQSGTRNSNIELMLWCFQTVWTLAAAAAVAANGSLFGRELDLTCQSCVASCLMSALLKCRTKTANVWRGREREWERKNDKSFAVENGEIPKDEVICVVSQVNFEHNARFNLEYSLFKSFSSPSFSHFIDTYPVRRPSRHIQRSRYHLMCAEHPQRR